MDKVIICATCHDEIIGHECEKCEENEAVLEAKEQSRIDNYIDSLIGGL